MWQCAFEAYTDIYGLDQYAISLTESLDTVEYYDVERNMPRYENTPIQIYWKFYNLKWENVQIKKSDIFHISAQNINCGYSLEPPRRGGSNEYP